MSPLPIPGHPSGSPPHQAGHSPTYNRISLLPSPNRYTGPLVTQPRVPNRPGRARLSRTAPCGQVRPEAGARAGQRGVLRAAGRCGLSARAHPSSGHRAAARGQGARRAGEAASSTPATLLNPGSKLFRRPRRALPPPRPLLAMPRGPRPEGEAARDGRPTAGVLGSSGVAGPPSDAGPGRGSAGEGPPRCGC